MSAPLVLFGAFDRHNVGDLLFPHVAGRALRARSALVAGLAERDLRAAGGHAVQAVHRLAAAGALRGADLVHVGGEILTCMARQAAVMLSQGREVDALLSVIGREPQLEPAWLQAALGTSAALPYVIDRASIPGLRRVFFLGVGGADLDGLPCACREIVAARLSSADGVSVRDARTQAALARLGVRAELVPDPAVLVPRLLGRAIAARARSRAVQACLRSLPQGFVAVHLGAEFAADGTIEGVAQALQAGLGRQGLGVVVLRMGTAPWHDDPTVGARLVARLGCRGPAGVLESVHALDVCAVLARARAYAGSSLHGAIIATAFGVPAVAVLPPGVRAGTGKVAAYAGTWHDAQELAVCEVAGLGEALARALGSAPGAGRAQARVQDDRMQGARVREAQMRDAFARLGKGLA